MSWFHSSGHISLIGERVSCSETHRLVGTCNITSKLTRTVDHWTWVRHDTNSICISTTHKKSRIIPHLAARESEAQRNPVTCWSVAIIWSAGSHWSSQASMPRAFCSTAPVLLVEDSFLRGMRPSRLLKKKYICPKEYLPLSHTVFGGANQAKPWPTLWEPASWPEGHWFMWTPNGPFTGVAYIHMTIHNSKITVLK